MCGERGDFYYLYSDIIQELEQKNNDKIVGFYSFVELMREANSFTKPEDAFISGYQAKSEGKDYHIGLMDYFKQVDDELNNTSSQTEKQELFNELCEALGETRGLLTEFVEDFTKYSTVEIYFIDKFFKLGYESAFSNYIPKIAVS